MNDYRSSIGTDSRFDDEKYWKFARRSDPQFYAPRGLHPDAIVMIVCLVLAVAALFGVWYTEGGL